MYPSARTFCRELASPDSVFSLGVFFALVWTSITVVGSFSASTSSATADFGARVVGARSAGRIIPIASNDDEVPSVVLTDSRMPVVASLKRSTPANFHAAAALTPLLEWKTPKRAKTRSRLSCL